MRQTIFCQDGVWNGERILPEGYVKFVSTPAPAWVADKLPIYGGFFLDQWSWPVSRPTKLLLHGGRRRPDNDDRAIT